MSAAAIPLLSTTTAYALLAAWIVGDFLVMAGIALALKALDERLAARARVRRRLREC